MTQFHKWAPTAYVNTMEYFRRIPAGRSNVTMPWVLALVLSVILTALLTTRLVLTTSVTANSPVPRELATAPIQQREEHLLLERKIERLSKVVDRISTQINETYQTTAAADSLRHELVALSKTTESLRRELVDVSTHAQQVENSISNIDGDVSTPEKLNSILELQKKGLSRP